MRKRECGVSVPIVRREMRSFFSHSCVAEGLLVFQCFSIVIVWGIAFFLLFLSHKKVMTEASRRPPSVFSNVVPAAAAHDRWMNSSSSLASKSIHVSPSKRSSSGSGLHRVNSSGGGTTVNTPPRGSARGNSSAADAPSNNNNIAPPEHHIAEFRLIGTSSVKAWRLNLNRLTVVAEEIRLRNEICLQEAASVKALWSTFYAMVSTQHLKLSSSSSTTSGGVPLAVTNCIDGVPLLATMFVSSSKPSSPSRNSNNLASPRATAKTSTLMRFSLLTPPPTEKRPSKASGNGTSGPTGSGVRVTFDDDAAIPATAHTTTASHPPPLVNVVTPRRTLNVLEAVRHFDAAVEKQRHQVADTFSLTNNAWMPHKDITFLFAQWEEYYRRWCLRVGATPSSLLASFLCTMLIDETTDIADAQLMNRVVLEETQEIVSDAVAVMADKNEIATSSALSYGELCYVLRNVGMRIFPARDPVAGMRLLCGKLMDCYHRVHS